jgi:hypothetical protein
VLRLRESRLHGNISLGFIQGPGRGMSAYGRRYGARCCYLWRDRDESDSGRCTCFLRCRAREWIAAVGHRQTWVLQAGP